MKNNILLTVAIPTYNRNKILIDNLRLLLPQINDNCEILIVDNDSDIPVSRSIKEEFGLKIYNKCSIIKNVSNVGGSENIIRCIEYAKGDFVWLLGDDDKPNQFAITNIFEEITHNQDAILLNMYAEAPNHVFRDYTRKLTKGAAEYLGASNFYGEVLFISSLVFKRKKALEYIWPAYMYQSSCASQLIVALLALNVDGVAVYSSKCVVNSGAAETPDHLKYGSLHIALGFPTILYYQWSKDVYTHLCRHLINSRTSWITPFGIINQLLELSLSGKTDCYFTAIRHYREIGRGLYSIGSIFNREIFLYRLGLFVLLFPTLGVMVKKIMWRLIK